MTRAGWQGQELDASCWPVELTIGLGLFLADINNVVLWRNRIAVLDFPIGSSLSVGKLDMAKSGLEVAGSDLAELDWAIRKKINWIKYEHGNSRGAAIWRSPDAVHSYILPLGRTQIRVTRILRREVRTKL